MPESYSLFHYFLENHGRFLFLVSLLFVALLDPFNPYSHLFLIFYSITDAMHCYFLDGTTSTCYNLCLTF